MSMAMGYILLWVLRESSWPYGILYIIMAIEKIVGALLPWREGWKGSAFIYQLFLLEVYHYAIPCFSS